MEWVETTGRTVDEAKDAALDQLGVDEQDAEFEIIEEPKVGLFGRLRNEARVRARVRPTTPRPKEDRRGRRRQKDQRRSGGGGGRSTATSAPTAEASGDGGADGAEDDESGGGEGPRQKSKRGPRPARTRDNGRQSESGERSVDVPLLEQADVAKEFLVGLTREFGAQAEVATVEIDEDTVELQVTGQDLGLLIGPKGQTLAAIQELARTAVQRKTGGSNGRLLVDIAGYRAKRRVALERFTREQADKVLSSGHRMVLEPMSPADRKVVHDTVNEIAGVGTTSEGEEPRRRVVIVPEAG